MEIILPRLEKWQKDVYVRMADSRGSGKTFIVKAKRQCGKTILAEVILIKFALESKCTSIVIEPTQNQSRRVFRQIKNLLGNSKVIKSANETLLTMEFVNGSEILFKSAEQEDNLRGMTCTGVLVIDEGAFIKDDIYEILYPCTDANSAPILIISTPLFMTGEFYNTYERGMQKKPNIEVFNWSEYDTSKYLSKEKLEEYRDKLSPTKFRSEYLGEFIVEGSYIFGDLTKCILKGKAQKPAKYGGIDWGNGNGGDYTAFTLMNEDGEVTEIFSFNNLEPTLQIERITEIIKEHKELKTIIVELNSIGNVYFSMLKRKIQGVSILGFTTTNDTKRNIIENLIAAFQQDKIKIINDTELLIELQHYAIEKTNKGYTYNGADGYHDDFCISLALCYKAYKESLGAFEIRFSKN